ncbi:MAG: zinc metallopeptidase [Prosthecobacter sp.]|jgi:Zn-dependent membrane protease YugP|nr:zinc metallopeptidase [Prosthecobacter sp.]
MLLLPILVLAVCLGVCNWAASRYQTMLQEAGREKAPTAHTGAEIAQLFLNYQGAEGVEIMEHAGVITNYYEPRRRRLFLAPTVAAGTSLADWTLALHEAGHAAAEGEETDDLKWRQTVIKLCRYAPMLALILALGAMILLKMPGRFILIGLPAICFILLLLNLGTLSEEFRANRRLSRFLDKHLNRNPAARQTLEEHLRRAAMREVGDLISSPRYFFLSAIPGTGMARPSGRPKTG